jgi:branched-chain amino acid transport system ATP-binding protein
VSENGVVLAVEDVHVYYGNVHALKGVSLDVRRGEVVTLIGSNGAGKTTTLRAITGLNKVVSGEVLFQGENVNKVAPHVRVRHGMAYVQEGKRVFHGQTIEQNLLLGGYSRRIKRAELRAEVERIYELFPILRDKRVQLASSMSGGQQQMLAIGQALMAKPSLLLLDEPSGGLAPVIVGEVMDRVHQLKETGLGILLVEQAVEASFAVADHVTVLDMGRTVLSRRASEVSDLTVLQDAYFGRVAEPSP